MFNEVHKRRSQNIEGDQGDPFGKKKDVLDETFFSLY